MALSPKQKHDLRAKAHHLKPVVMIGDKGLTENVMTELNIAIEHHELIKVKIAGADKESRQEATNQICDAAKCELVQHIGNILVLYKRKIEKKQEVEKKRVIKKKSTK